jgi:RsiW-degrading membrane proteinase PrsW (M82 family)
MKGSVVAGYHRGIAKRPPDQELMVAGLGVLRLLPSQQSPSSVMLARIGSKERSSYVAPIAAAVTTIGRGLQNAVVLLDPTVSREQAVLERTGAGSWRIHNVSGQQPLAVEDREILPGTQAELVPGTIIRMGNCRLLLLAPARAETSGLPAIVEESDSTRVMAPGVTLQFALAGQRYPQLRWLIGVVAVLVLALCGLSTLAVAAQVGQNAFSSGGFARVLLAVTIPMVPALGVSLLIGIFDRYEREPWPTLLGAFLFGAVIAIPPTLVLERTLSTLVLVKLGGSGTGTELLYAGGQAAIAGVIEEVVKGIGLLLLVFGLRDEFDNVTDGVLYGLLIGAGFAVVENFMYFALSPANQLPYLVLARIVLGWLSHSTFTALFGAGLGYAREHAYSGRSGVYFPLLGLVAGVLLHALFDWIVFAATALGNGGQETPAISPFFLIFALLVLGYGPVFAAQGLLLRLLLASLGREAETVRTYLTDELLLGVVLPDEYLILQDARLRGGAERRVLRNFGPWTYLTARALYQTATGLAFRKWHVAQGDRPKNTPQQPEDVYRRRIARLRSSLSRQMGGA